MTIQLNPAWQRRSASSSRLATISKRLLSDPSESTQHDDHCRAIPFLLDTPEQSWITHDLCRTLNQEGHETLLCHLQEPSATASPLWEDLDKQADHCEYCLLPVLAPATLCSHGFNHVVVPVPAGLDAMRTAYQRIKLLSENTAPAIGIIVVGPRDQHSAWRYFRKLAVGTLRYLDVPLVNLGFLPERVTPQHGPADHHRNNFLSHVCGRLIRSRFYITHSPLQIAGQRKHEHTHTGH